MTEKERKKLSKYSITLKENGETFGTYRIPYGLFCLLSKNLEQYRSTQPESRRVLCVEKGIVFRNSQRAISWLASEGKTSNYGGYTLIKQACSGKRKTAYGYHWKFIN